MKLLLSVLLVAQCLAPLTVTLIDRRSLRHRSASEGPAGQDVLRPVDHSSRDPEFRAVKLAILEAVGRRDAQAIRPFLADDVRYLGESKSADWMIKDLAEAAGGNAGANGLADLGRALRMGAVMLDGGFAAPYTALAADRMEDFSAKDATLLITGSGVRARAAASESAAVVAVLSFGLVKEDPLSATTSAVPGSTVCPHWVPITTALGRRAWVCAEFTRDITGPYYRFEKRQGEWKLVSIYVWD